MTNKETKTILEYYVSFPPNVISLIKWRKERRM